MAAAIPNVSKTLLEAGNGSDTPKQGDKIAMQYTGWLYDPNAHANDFKGEQWVAFTFTNEAYTI